ncbi:hypothetical protein [Oligella sp. MSHR50489EDL]|uniref:hypothetical protein n=1 Tax=Oligella sp. MSHR50489EDL TaxID=3139409 RepID=UPI003D819557
MQKVTGYAEIRSMSPHWTISNVGGAFYTRIATNQQIGASSNGQLQSTVDLVLDTSRVARTSTETRSSNTAFAPRIIAF